ncbi:NAD(P)H-dependent glycerol-3-phosphate dehydrogenase [Rhodospirillaceae bacterium SYSU D60014]|uniref:NAD(P)H-dependent glycerol-3-phosphate dehydrogenase n=1 Tax=Virgifigura deserti TaxID=2268457 RepID=UPI000E66AD17
MTSNINDIRTIGVIGAGAWGTALASVTRRAGRAVLLWAHEAEVAAAINKDHENPLFLPDVSLDPGIAATADLAAAGEADALLLVPPAQHLRAVTGALAPSLPDGTPIVLCAKGVEQETGRLMSEVVAETLPGRPVAVLSGPTFAAEVARDLPTAVTVAAADPVLGRRLVEAIGTPHFRPYLSDDPVGAEIGGAVKNVIAIACGILIGRRLGDNARAALITRGLAEMVRLGLAKGAREATLMGLSGLGDLTLTCSGPQSRNLSLGIALGEGRPLADILDGRRSVAEGVFTAASVTQLAERLGVDMPIAAAVNAILHRGADINETIAGLLARPFRAEATERGAD